MGVKTWWRCGYYTDGNVWHLAWKTSAIEYRVVHEPSPAITHWSLPRPFYECVPLQREEIDIWE